MLNPKQRERIITEVVKRVRKHHINIAGVDYDAWEREFERKKQSLLFTELANFESGIRESLQDLRSSHTGFFHHVQNQLRPQHGIGATLKAVDHGGTKRWMFLDVFPEGPAAMAKIGPGEFLHALDDSPTAPPELHVFSAGTTHELLIENIAEKTFRKISVSIPSRKGSKQTPPIVLPKPITSRMEEPSIGVLRIPYFPGAFGMRFGSALAKSIADLKNKGCERLIVDLRGNIGGSLGFAVLASYFCPDKRPIGYSVTPKSLHTGFSREGLRHVPMPKDRTELISTLARFALRDKSVVLLTQGLGPQPFHGRIVVLINEWTNSAGEMAAGFAQENDLATIIGTKTGGNVLGAQNYNVGHDYWVRLPVFGWFMWSGRSLEGRGVCPSVVLDVETRQLAAGFDQQMNRALEIARHPVVPEFLHNSAQPT